MVTEAMVKRAEQPEGYKGVNQPTGPDLFDAKLSEFQQWQESPWGRLRYAVAAANLAKHLPPSPLSILDIGGGNGLDAIELAARGHHVTIVDISEQSLAQARAVAADRGVADRISTRLSDVGSLDREFAPGSVDVVLCHNVIQYLDKPGPVLATLAQLIGPGGWLSVLAPNPLCDPLVAAVRRADLDAALRLLDTTERVSVTYGREYSSRTADDLIADIVAAGMNPPVRYGVRAVCDLIADDDMKHDLEFFARLLRLENTLADRRPYADSARFFHLIATKPDQSVGAVAEMRRCRIPFDIPDYEQRVRNGSCSVCEFLAGTPGFEHDTVYDDGDHVGFLNKYPTLPGSVLVVPRRHVTDVVGELTSLEYLRLQSAVHTVARAVAATVDPERVYLMSMGSAQGNAHVHWHIAPLPPGVPYHEQQFRAVAADNGILGYTREEFAALAESIRATLTSNTDTDFGSSVPAVMSDRRDGVRRSGRLVVIRGGSGSGKTTVAREVQHRFDRAQCLVVPQDVVRRQFLRESEIPDGVNVDLIRDIATLGLARGLTVVVEGILTARRYGPMLQQLACHAERACFYAFDLTFEQSLQRHSRRAKAAEFGRDDMRHWYQGWDPLGFVDETRLDATSSLEDIVASIHADITTDTARIPAAAGLPLTTEPADTAVAEPDHRATPASRAVVVRCWGTSHTEHAVAVSSRLTDPADIPEIGDYVTVDGRGNGGFVHRLETSLAALLPDVAFTIHNHGRGGATSRDLLASLEHADLDQDLALVECGTNDVLRRAQGRNCEAVDIEEFTRNLRAILDHLASRSRRVVLLAAPPVGPTISLSAEAINRDLIAYNRVARTVARDAGALSVDCWGAFVTTAALLCEQPGNHNRQRSPWLADGIHLSAIGDELILRNLEATLIGQHVIAGLLLPSAPARSKARTEIVIRQARPEDIPAAVRLRVAVAEERTWIGAEPPVDENQAADSLHNLVHADDAGVFVGDHPRAGVVALATTSFALPGVAEITMMIAADRRGHGIGTALLTHLIDWCASHHAHKVTLRVWPHNLPAIGLYQRAGFDTEGILRAHCRRGNGELWDVIIMSRLL
ncbi:GNAT family N-acetyltransferase [Nocardia sp. XZ_19_369]|uniref:GNAT family N-acetyltransferase n=1 Tax=Nocardia sp. XZ_19_369 TaxID=2769487 RepID=UPI00188F6FFB|nr:GNAT family N-acetyltransferase [Nocardia sp. XZ_19_369]